MGVYQCPGHSQPMLDCRLSYQTHAGAFALCSLPVPGSLLQYSLHRPPTTTSTMDDSVSANLDDLELEAVGYKREMPRQFSVWSLSALSFTLTCTWLGFGSAVGTGITEASGAGAIWSLAVAGLMTAVLSLGMAELASAYPVAGAQYYWSYMVASEPYKPFAAFVNGWLSVIGWWMAACSVSNFVASMILSIALLWHSGYEYHHRHHYLVAVLLMWMAVAVNIFGHHVIPMFNKLIGITSGPVLSECSRPILCFQHTCPCLF